MKQLVTVLTLMLAGCGSNQKSQGEQQAPADPTVTPREGGDPTTTELPEPETATTGAFEEPETSTVGFDESDIETADVTASGGATAPPSGGATAPPAGARSVAQVIVDAHNRYRAKHCAPPLKWSDEVAAVAQAWADKLLEAGCAFEHSQGNKYGENLFFYGPAGATDGTKAVDVWYGEVADYDFSSPGFGMNTGHFTQVVWVGTREVGCGMARCSGGDIWVCNYNPPGNVMRHFAKNVRPTTCK